MNNTNPVVPVASAETLAALAADGHATIVMLTCHHEGTPRDKRNEYMARVQQANLPIVHASYDYAMFIYIIPPGDVDPLHDCIDRRTAVRKGPYRTGTTRQRVNCQAL